MADNKNALAELAERLRNIADVFYCEDTRRFGDVYCASRIVAELAKVEKPIDLRTVGMAHLADILEADKNRAVEIVRNCRAIAEEGIK